MSFFKKDIPEELVRKIDRLAIETMEQQGILFESERALDIFRENGFYIEAGSPHSKGFYLVWPRYNVDRFDYCSKSICCH